jgi:hypothetical protein
MAALRKELEAQKIRIRSNTLDQILNSRICLRITSPIIVFNFINQAKVKVQTKDRIPLGIQKSQGNPTQDRSLLTKDNLALLSKVTR